MARSLVISGSINPATSTANTTEYWDLYGYTDKSTNSDYRTGSIYDDGTLSNLKVKLQTNSVPGSGIVFTLMVNGAAVNQTISIPASGTGNFEDTSHTDALGWGDDIVLRAVPDSTGTYQITYTSMIYTPNTAGQSTSHFKAAHASGRTFATASTTFFEPINGYMDTNNSTVEANTQYKIKQAGSMLGLQAWVSGNSRTTATTIRIRKGGVAQTPSISIGNQATGWFGDEATSFSVAVDDLLNSAIITGTGTQNISVTHITSAIDVANDTKQSTYIGQNMIGIAQARNIVRYYAFCGYYSAQTTEPIVKFDVPVTCVAKNLNIYVSANTVASASSFSLRVNAANSAVSVSIGSTTTGWLQDVTHTVTLLVADQIDYMLASGTGSGSQTMTTRGYGIVLEIPDAVAPVAMSVVSNVMVDDKMILKA